MFMYIKGYDITLLGKRSLKKLRLSPAMQAVIDTNTLKAQMEAALEENGRIYALYRKKELVACYLFAKRTRTAESFLKEEDLSRIRKADHVTVYELIHDYNTPETEARRGEVEGAFLQDLKECSLLYGVDAILWKEHYFLPEFGDASSGDGVAIGIALGLLFGLIFDNIALGVLIGIALSPLFGWNRHHKQPDKKEV